MSLENIFLGLKKKWNGLCCELGEDNILEREGILTNKMKSFMSDTEEYFLFVKGENFQASFSVIK